MKTNSALRASDDASAEALADVLREHGTPWPASLRQDSRCDSSARVLRLWCPCGSTLRHHTRGDCGCAIATAACGCRLRLPPTDCGLWRVSSLRLRCSFLCVWAFDCTATPNTADCLAQDWQGRGRDSEFSALFTPLRSACVRLMKSAFHSSVQNSGRAQAPLRLRSGRRNIGDTRVMLTAFARPAYRVWERTRLACSVWRPAGQSLGCFHQTMRPREMRCASFGTAGLKEQRLRMANTVLTALRSCGSALLGQSPNTTAVMLRAAPLPIPAIAGPSATGSPPAHRE